MTNRNIAFGICVAIAALFGFAIILGSWYTIDQTQRGVFCETARWSAQRSPVSALRFR